MLSYIKVSLIALAFWCWNPIHAQSLDGDVLFESGSQFHFDGKYDSAIHLFERAKAVFLVEGNQGRVIEVAYALGESMTNAGQCDNAQETIEDALVQAGKLWGDASVVVADGYYYLSRAQGGCARQFEKALETLDRSTEIRLAYFGEESNEVSFNYTMKGYYSSALGNYDSALFYLQRALQIRENLGIPDSVEFSHTLSLLSTAYDRKGEVRQALTLAQQSLEIRQRKLIPIHPSISNSFNDIGNVYKNLGNFERALDYYLRSLEIRKETLGEDHVNVGASYYTIGNLYGSTFNYRRAIYFIEQGNLILKAKYGESAGILHTYYAYLGSMYGFAGEHDKAIQLLNLAERLAEDNLREDHPYLGIVYSLIGDYYYREGKLDLQISYFEKAQAIYIKAYGSGTIREADALVRLGEASFKKAKVPQAEKYYDQALAIYLQKLGEKNSKVSGLYQNLGKTASDHDDYEQALSYYSKSLEAISLDSANFYQLPLDVSAFTHKHRAMRSFQRIGQIKQKLFIKSNKVKDLQEAFKNYQFALELIDYIISSYNLEISKNQLEEESRSVYEEAIRTAFELYKETGDENYMHQAFEIAEKSKSPILLSKIRDSEAKKFNNVPNELLDQERDISIELSYFKEQMREASSKGDSSMVSFYQRKVFEAQSVVEEFKNELKERFPSYYDHQYAEEVADVQRVRRYLPEGAVVLEYFESKNASYLFIISEEDFELLQLPLDISYDEVVIGYQKSLTDGEFIVSNPSQADSLFTSTSAYLFDRLIKPAKDFLINAKRLIIIPDGRLSAVNFSTLLTKKPTGKIRYSNLDYLLKKFQISYAYSSTLNFRPNNNRYSFSFGGFAPSYDTLSYTTLDSFSHPMAYQLVRNGKLPLPGAISEVSQISAFMDGESWVNEEASESTFKNKSAEYSVLHLAMHSLLNADDPEYSELLFNGELDSLNDGYLNIEEIYNLDLNAEMIVLSACSSGGGKMQVGEGPISFTRAFRYAGCPSVVMSLWKIPDEATSQIMIAFYKNIKAGDTKDLALKKAQLEYLSSTENPLYQHPFFWGSFVAMGDPSPVQVASSSRKVLAVVISLIVLIAFARVRRKLHFPS